MVVKISLFNLRVALQLVDKVQDRVKLNKDPYKLSSPVPKTLSPKPLSPIQTHSNPVEKPNWDKVYGRHNFLYYRGRYNLK